MPVRLWQIHHLQSARRESWQVRWCVGSRTRPFTTSFATAALAEGFHEDLHAAMRRGEAIDTALMALSVTSLILVCTWGGTEYDWTSPTILLLCAATVAAAVLFCLVERRVAEPLIPLRMLRNPVFSVATRIGMIAIGVGMFAVISYMPTYLQMVYGYSATESGLLLLPMVAGIMLTATTLGALVSKFGRYKGFVIAGMIVMPVGVWLMLTLDSFSPVALLCSYIALIGAGIGLIMQTLVLAVQNAFPQSEVGTVLALFLPNRTLGDDSAEEPDKESVLTLKPGPSRCIASRS